MSDSFSSRKSENAAAKKSEILIVEDEIDLRKLLRRVFEKSGYEVLEAENGKVALDFVMEEEHQFDVILSDVRMPVMDGLNLLLSLRPKSTVPFIFMTGYSRLLDEKLALKLGANAFIYKPFRTDQILTIVKSWIGKRSPPISIGPSPSPTNERFS